MKCSRMLHFIWVFPVCRSTRLKVSSIQRVNVWPLLTEPNLGQCGMHYFVSLILMLEDRNTLHDTLFQVIFIFSVVVVYINPFSEGFSYTYWYNKYGTTCTVVYCSFHRYSFLTYGVLPSLKACFNLSKKCRP